MTNVPLVSVATAAISALEAADVDYAVTGSVISGVYGEPVVSLDVAIVLVLTIAQAAKLVGVLPKRFYCPEGSLERIAAQGGMTNLIDTETALKIDLSAMHAGPFRDAVFSRKTRVSLGPDSMAFFGVSPEDLVLMKLIWRKESRSQKQWDNALSVAQVQGTRLDWKYLFEQAGALFIEADLVKLRDEAGI